MENRVSFLENPIIKPSIPGFYVPSFCRGCWIFDSASGKIIDYSQYGNNGTNSGSTNKGNKNSFNGSSNYISLPNSTSLDLTTAPIAVFAKANIAASAGYIFSKNLDSSANVQYALIMNSNVGNLNFYGNLNGTSYGDTANVNSIANNVWYDIGFIWNGATIQYYKNFKTLGTPIIATGTLTSRANVRIGRRETAGVHFNGAMENVCVYASTDVNEVLRHRKALSQISVIAI